MDPVNLIIISFRVQYAEKFAEFGGMKFVFHSHCSKFVRNTTTSGSIKLGLRILEARLSNACAPL